MDAQLGRRALTRLPVEVRATFAIDTVEHECTITNLSLGGARLACTAAASMAMGDRCRLRFTLPLLGESVDAMVVVRWRNETQIGLQFDGLRAREVWALNQFFQDQERAAS